MKKTKLTACLLILINLAFSSCSGNKTSNKEVRTNPTEATPSSKDINYLELGKDIAMQTKGNLGKYLISALGTSGPKGALDICNVKAIPITDSVAKELSASIKRVSDKNRNPSNEASASELAYINKWKEYKEKNETLEPQLKEIDGKMVGYYPIITNQMCLQCHGNPGKEINAETLAKINGLYPKDKATGYKIDEIRGIFVVGMNKK